MSKDPATGETVTVTVALTPAEVEALCHARELAREHLAHRELTRDLAIGALDRIIVPARRPRP